ncbi:MAG TPA: hypothetical protein VFH31_02980 [Pyrinomonadaceae bacterium]|nr:hypothetical protein [Pyrinomonadaceae bacterium]
MTVRKTERRLPTGYQATDLGEAVVPTDGRCALISFATAPIVTGRDNTYVLFITDATLAAAAQSIEWTFTENDEVARVEADGGTDIVYRPTGTGPLAVAVRLLDAAGASQASLTLEQFIVLPSSEIEALIASFKDQPGPGASDPEALRELVNQHCRYYHPLHVLLKPVNRRLALLAAFFRLAFVGLCSVAKLFESATLVALGRTDYLRAFGLERLPAYTPNSTLIRSCHGRKKGNFWQSIQYHFPW